MCSGLDAVGCAKNPAKTRSFVSWANSVLIFSGLASKWSLDHTLQISFKSANSFLVKYSPTKWIFLRHYLRNTFKACIFGTRPPKTVLSTPKETLSHTFGPHWTPGSGSTYFIFANFSGQFHKTVFRIRCRRLCRKARQNDIFVSWTNSVLIFSGLAFKWTLLRTLQISFKSANSFPVNPVQVG